MFLMIWDISFHEEIAKKPQRNCKETTKKLQRNCKNYKVTAKKLQSYWILSYEFNFFYFSFFQFISIFLFSNLFLFFLFYASFGVIFNSSSCRNWLTLTRIGNQDKSIFSCTPYFLMVLVKNLGNLCKTSKTWRDTFGCIYDLLVLIIKLQIMIMAK